MAADLEALISGKSLAIRKLTRRLKTIRRRMAGIVGTTALIVAAAAVWFFQNRAAEQDRRRELREIQLSRTGLRMAGWFSEYWARIERASAVRNDEEVLEQACAALAGWDARLVKQWKGLATGSVAFSSDGRALFGGIGGSPTLMVEAHGNSHERRCKS
jgi:hypothetical protein